MNPKNLFNIFLIKASLSLMVLGLLLLPHTPAYGQVTVVQAPLPGATGEQRVIVILVNFLDKTSQPFSAATANNVVFTQTDAYYAEASYQKTWLSGTVVGWYTLPMTLGTSCPEDQIFSEAVKAADPNVNFNNYDRIMIMFPRLAGCNWGGLGTLGKSIVTTNDGTVSASKAWINYNLPDLGVVGHELGHNLGVHHANALDCGAQVVTNETVSETMTTCTDYEYGDFIDIMGVPSNGHMNASFKNKLGWFDAANVVTLQTSQDAGTYTVEPLENFSTGVQLIRVLKGMDSFNRPNYYNIEYRRPIGQDSFLSSYANIINGALVHLDFDTTSFFASQTRLLDMTPNSNTSPCYTYGCADFYDSSLKIGTPFTEPTGVEISTIAMSTSSLMVNVNFPQSPRVLITRPQDGAFVRGVYNLGASVISDQTISQMNFYADGVDLGADTISPYGLAWDTRNEVDGPHVLTAVAQDVSGNQGVSPLVNATVDNTPPAVSITSPANGSTVSGQVQVTVNASDATSGINYVLCAVDGVIIDFYDQTAASPYIFTWDTTNEVNGIHTITAWAEDRAGNRSNNQNITVTLTGSAPDLITSSLSTTATAVTRGSSFTLSNTAANQGTTSAGSFKIAFSLSTDAVYGGTGDIAFSATRSVTSLAAGANSSASTSLTVPTTTPLGNYYVCAKVDSGNTVTESDEANNGRCTTSTIQVALPDLVMTAVSGPSSGTRGTSISISNTVTNQGAGNAASFYVGLYLSTDAVITTTDSRVGTRSVTSLAAGATSSATTSVTIPSTLAVGTYYIGAIADYANARVETNETNNALTGNQINVVLPDLVMTAVSGPTSGTRGTSISISNTVTNQGTGNAASFSVGLYLSTDAVITTTDSRVGTRSVTSLAAGATSSATTSVTIPSTLAVGTYYIGAIADYANARVETNETNNALTGNQINVVLPDLVMTAVSGPASGTVGAAISLVNTVANQGAGNAASFSVGLYLSSDAVITTTDSRVGTRSVTSLAAGATSSATTSVTIPTTLALGTYYIGAIADYANQRVESNETNNSFAGNQISIVAPDLVMTAVSGPTSGTRGTSISISNTVTNQGAGNAASFSVGLYLSSDAVITTTDSRVGTRSVTSLAAGATSSATTSVTIPATLAVGTYYIGAIADYANARVETNETNNARAGNQINVVLPDLVMTGVSGPTSGTRGTSISISNTVTNQGAGNAASFSVGLYLSSDAVITTTDSRVGTRSVTSLAAGATSSATTSVTIPATLAVGTYYIGAIADYANARVETNETNNARAGNTLVVQ